MALFAFVIGLLLIAALVASYPLVFESVEAFALDAESSEEEPFNERDTVLEALSDLDESMAMGKLSDADYALQKAELEHRYAELLQAGGG